MYNPQLARYMQPDPIGVNGGMNIYSYVENSPLNYSDPWGLRILTDSDGQWKFTPYKNKNTGFDIIGESLDKKARYIEGHFTTDKGIEIPVSKYLDGPPRNSPSWYDYTTDCHGVTFTSGKYWIDNHNVELILNEEYIIIPYSDIEQGDIGVVSVNNEIVHSLTVNNLNGILFGFEKTGIAPGPFTSFRLSWINALRHVTYYRRIQ